MKLKHAKLDINKYISSISAPESLQWTKGGLCLLHEI